MNFVQFVCEKHLRKYIRVCNKSYSNSIKNKSTQKSKQERTVSPLKGHEPDDLYPMYSMNRYKEITNKIYHIFNINDSQ